MLAAVRRPPSPSPSISPREGVLPKPAGNTTDSFLPGEVILDTAIKTCIRGYPNRFEKDKDRIKNHLTLLRGEHQDRLNGIGHASGETAMEKQRLEHRIHSINQLLVKVSVEAAFGNDVELATLGFSSACSYSLDKVNGISALDTVILKKGDSYEVIRLSNSISLQFRHVLDEVKKGDGFDNSHVTYNIGGHAIDSLNLNDACFKGESITFSAKFPYNSSSYYLPNGYSFPPFESVSYHKPSSPLELYQHYLPHLASELKDHSKKPIDVFIITILNQIDKLDCQLQGTAFEKASCSFECHSTNITSEDRERLDQGKRLLLQAKYTFLKVIEEYAPSGKLIALDSQSKKIFVSQEEAQQFAKDRYKKACGIFERNTLSADWKTNNGRAILYPNRGLQGDDTIEKWVDITQKGKLKELEEESEETFPKNPKDMRGRAFYLEQNVTPVDQVVDKNEREIKLTSVLLSHISKTPLFSFLKDRNGSKVITTKIAQDLMNNLSKLKPLQLRQTIAEVLNYHSEEDLRKAVAIEKQLLIEMSQYAKFCDHKGLCCPDCSGGKSGDKCEVDHIPQSNIDISVSDEGTFDSLNFIFDDSDFEGFLSSYCNQMDSFLAKIQDDDNKTLNDSVKDEFQKYHQNMSDYQKDDDFKYAMLLDFSNHFLSMLIQNRDSLVDSSKQAKKDELTKIISKFREFLNGVLGRFVTELNKSPISSVKDKNSSLYVSRFYYAECIKFATILGSDNDSKVEYSDDTKRYIDTIKIKLDDDEEREWFKQFRHTFNLNKMKGLDVTQNLSEQIANYCGGISANLLTGEQGVGKSETKKNSKHPLIVNDKGERLTDGEPPYLRLSEDRLVKVFELNNDEAGTQKGDGAYPKGQFRITFDKSKKEKVLRDFTALGIEFEEINDGDASLDDSEGVIAGCICCKDRDKALQMLADISSVGNEMTRAILIEPTGIADGSGILNMSHVPLGRVFWDQNIMFANPQNPVWGNIESIVDFCKDQGIGYDGFKDLEFDEVSDQGLKDCLSTNNISTGIQFNRLKTLLAPCLLATGVVINDRGGFPLDGQKARFEKIMSFVNDHSEFDVQVLNCKTEQLKLEEFKHSIQLRSVGVEIGDFDGEFAKTNQVAGLFQLSMEPDRFTEVEDYFLGMLASCLDDGSIKREKGATPRGDEVEVAVNRLYYLSKVISDVRISELKIRAQAALKKIQQKLKDEIRNKHKKHQESLALLNSISKEACGKNFDDISCFLDLDKVNSEIDKAIKK